MVCSSGVAKTPEREDVDRIADLVLANHILVNQGVLDAFGHISVRSARNPNHYFISRSRAPAQVSADDIMEYDLDDHPIDARGRVSISSVSFTAKSTKHGPMFSRSFTATRRAPSPSE
jgi:hypothetical protein